MTTFWSLHSHSRYSAQDAISPIKTMVSRAVELGYPALGLTDHGTPAGAVQLYQACNKAGIKPLPGTELYMTPDHTAKEQRSNHLTVAAYTGAGYRNLVKLNTLAANNFYYRPRIDIADLVELSDAGLTEGLLCATGCRSGLVVRTLMAHGPAAARRVAANLAMLFPLTYIEVMNHGINTDGWRDDDICRALVAIADDLGLPIIITGDSHYVTADQQHLHDGMKELLTFAEDPADGRFSGCGYHLVDTDWLTNYLEPDVLDRGLRSLTDLANLAEVRIPELDVFKVKVPDITYGGDPDEQVAAEARQALIGLDLTDEVYAQRVTDELAVIKLTGMAGYLLLVALICQWMREQDIWFWARGSATGSLVCMLLGITQDDPVEWNIRFDRFLSGDRTSPPDIDLDIDSSRRGEVVTYVSSRFATRQVGQYSAFGLDTNDDEQKGSLKVQYFATQAKRARAGGGKYFRDPKARIPDEEWQRLVALDGLGVIKNLGTHPAGFVVADSDADLEILPMSKIGSKGSLVTAYDKDDLEPLGFPKFDLLGLKTARALRIACELIWPDNPKAAFDLIPLNDPQALARAGGGETASFFQLEGWSQRKGLEELHPTKTSDIISAQALFRPGVSQEFLGTYMRRRRKEEPIPVMHADITSELKDTYCVAIFQEQVVGVLRNLGMPPLELTAMLKAVKSSGKAGLVKAKEAVREALPGIIALGEARGWSSDDVVWLESALTDYAAGYSFGKAHSVRYGIVAYRCAYLSVWHPLEYWTGMLIAYTGHKNMKKQDVEMLYLSAMRRTTNLQLLPVDVSHSQVEYSAVPESHAIRRGLVSISGIGSRTAQEIVANQPYRSLADFGRRCNTSVVSGARELALGTPLEELGERTAVRILAAAGALKGLE